MNFPLVRARSVSTVAAGVLLVSTILSSFGGKTDRIFPLIAIDGKGGKHLRYQRGGYPWSPDVLRYSEPEYPYRARRRGEEGTDVFRLTIDLKTGAVHDIAVLHSTGVTDLDESALGALRGWRWKPGKWKSVEVEFIFKMSHRRHGHHGLTIISRFPARANRSDAE